MDYHTMKRKELQALCKKNNIPANLTNLEMASKLTSLNKGTGKPKAPGPSCLKKSIEVVVIDDSDVESKSSKKVKFSPQNELFEITNNNPRKTRRMTRRNSMFVNNPVRATRTRAQNLLDDGLVSSMNHPVEKQKSSGSKEMIAELDELKLPTRRLLRNREVVQNDVVSTQNHAEDEERFECDKEIVNKVVRNTRPRAQVAVNDGFVSIMNPPVENKKGSKSRNAVAALDEVKLPTKRLSRNRKVDQNDADSIQDQVEDAKRFKLNEEIVNKPVRVTRSRTESSVDEGLASIMNPPDKMKSGRNSIAEITEIAEVKLPTRRLLRNREVVQNDAVLTQNHAEDEERFDCDAESVNKVVRTTRSRAQGAETDELQGPGLKGQKKRSKLRNAVTEIDEVKLPTKRLLRNRKVDQIDVDSIQNHVGDAERFEPNEEIVNNPVRVTRSRTESLVDEGLASILNPPVKMKSGRKSIVEITKIDEVKLQSGRLLRSREVKETILESIQNHIAKRGRKRTLDKLQVLSDDNKEKQPTCVSIKNGGKRQTSGRYNRRKTIVRQHADEEKNENPKADVVDSSDVITSSQSPHLENPDGAKEKLDVSNRIEGKRQTSGRCNRRKTVVNQLADEEKVENPKADVVDSSDVITSSQSPNLENPDGAEEKLDEILVQDYTTEEVKDVRSTEGTDIEKGETHDFVDMEEMLVDIDEKEAKVKVCSDINQASFTETTVAKVQEANDTAKYVEISPTREFPECKTSNKACTEYIKEVNEMTIGQDTGTFVSKNSESVKNDIEDSVDLEGLNDKDYQETVVAKESRDENEMDACVVTCAKDNMKETFTENEQVVCSNSCEEKESSSDEKLAEVTISLNKEIEGLKEIEQNISLHDTGVNVDEVEVSVQGTLSCEVTHLQDDVIQNISNMEDSVDREKLDAVEVDTSDDNLKLMNCEGAFDSSIETSIHDSTEEANDTAKYVEISLECKTSNKACTEYINEVNEMTIGQDTGAFVSKNSESVKNDIEDFVDLEGLNDNDYQETVVTKESRDEYDKDACVVTSAKDNMKETFTENEHERLLHLLFGSPVVCSNPCEEKESSSDEKLADVTILLNKEIEGLKEIEQNISLHDTGVNDDEVEVSVQGTLSCEVTHLQDDVIQNFSNMEDSVDCEKLDVVEVATSDDNLKLMNYEGAFDSSIETSICNSTEGEHVKLQGENDENRESTEDTATDEHTEKPHLLIKETVAHNNVVLEHPVSVSDDNGISSDLHSSLNAANELDQAVLSKFHVRETEEMMSKDENEHMTNVACAATSKENSSEGCVELKQDDKLYSNNNALQRPTDEENNGDGSNEGWHDELKILFATPVCENRTVRETWNASFGKFDKTQEKNNGEETFISRSNDSWHGTTEAAHDESTNSSLHLEPESVYQDTEDSNAVQNNDIEQQISGIMETSLKIVEKVEFMEENKKGVEDGTIYYKDLDNVAGEDTLIARKEADYEALLINNELGSFEPDNNRDIINELPFEESVYDSQSNGTCILEQGETMVKVVAGKLNEFQEFVQDGGDFNAFTGSAIRKFVEQIEVDEVDKSNARQSETKNVDENQSSIMKTNYSKSIVDFCFEDEELNNMFATPMVNQENKSYNVVKSNNIEVRIDEENMESAFRSVETVEVIDENKNKAIVKESTSEVDFSDMVIENVSMEANTEIEISKEPKLEDSLIVYKCKTDDLSVAGHAETEVMSDNKVQNSETMETSLKIVEKVEFMEEKKKGVEDGTICYKDLDNVAGEDTLIARKEVDNEALLINNELGSFEPDNKKDIINELPFEESVYDSQSNGTCILEQGEAMVEVVAGKLKEFQEFVQNGSDFNAFTGSAISKFVEQVEVDEVDKSNARQSETKNVDENQSSVMKTNFSKSIADLCFEDEELNSMFATPMVNQENKSYNVVKSNNIEVRIGEENMESAFRSVETVEVIDENKKKAIVKESTSEVDFSDMVIENVSMEANTEIEISKESKLEEYLFVDKCKTDDLSVTGHAEGEVMSENKGIGECGDLHICENQISVVTLDDTAEPAQVTTKNPETKLESATEKTASVAEGAENSVAINAESNAFIHAAVQETVNRDTNEILPNCGEFDAYTEWAVTSNAETIQVDEFEKSNAKEAEIDCEIEQPPSVAEVAFNGEAIANVSNGFFDLAVKENQVGETTSEVLEDKVCNNVEEDHLTWEEKDWNEANIFEDFQGDFDNIADVAGGTRRSLNDASDGVNECDGVNQSKETALCVANGEGEVKKDSNNESVRIQKHKAMNPNDKNCYSTTMKVKLKNSLMIGTPNKLFADMKENVRSVKKEPSTENITEAKGLTKRRALGRI